MHAGARPGRWHSTVTASLADIEFGWEGCAAEILDLSGTDDEALSGAPFPHAQHIHAGGEGRCPSPDGDTDGDGIIDTPQGGLAYGGVVTSLTTGDADTGPGGTLDIETSRRATAPPTADPSI